MKPIEGYPAMVSFNASVSEALPDIALGYVGFVKVPLLHPTKDGLISKEEEGDIGFMEDSLEMESLRYRIGTYVGRIVTKSEINFIYYLKYEFEWSDTVNAAMKKFADYKFEMGSRADFEWEVYQKLLYPTSKEWQIIQNHNSCDALSKAGDTLQISRAIEHKMYFEREDDRDSFLKAIAEDGFDVQKEMHPTADIPLYGVQFYRVDVPFYYNIDELTLAIIEKGELHNGQYDGWETSLVKE
jgi:hypothetical protein